MQFIHERANWPAFTWDTGALAVPLSAVRHKQASCWADGSNGIRVRAEANLSC